MSQELTDLINAGPDPSYSSLGSPRRFYLAKRHAAACGSDTDLVETWRAKQEAEPGTPLPADFPHLETLEEQGYEMVEDLTGAGTSELETRGFGLSEAEEIIAALAAL